MKYSLIIVTVLSFAVSILSSCSGSDEKIKSIEAERDSLAAVANDAKARYDDISVFLTDISECVDSVWSQEGLVLITTDKETGRRYSRAEMRQRIAGLGSLIERQRARIALLVDSLGTKNIKSQDVERLTQVVTYLNQQLAAKEVELKRLQTELLQSKKSIAELQTSIASANATNEQLTNENSALDQIVVEKSNQLSQGWLMVKTKKDLQQLGVLSKGGLLKKSKFNPGNVSTSDCTPIDINTFTHLNLKSGKKPQVLSQIPTDSYVINEIGDDKWELIISDTMSFWSLSKIVVIQVQ